MRLNIILLLPPNVSGNSEQSLFGDGALADVKIRAAIF
jgi:hypothetical protein